MDFGVNLATSADSWKVVRRAEELGYTRAWFYDTQMLNADMFVAMGAAAVQTSRIRLATGVLIPSNRIAPVAASALAALNALAPGRIDFGISTGFTARRTMGLRPVKLEDMAEYIRIVQCLLAGETLEWTPATATDSYEEDRIPFTCVTRTNFTVKSDRVPAVDRQRCKP